MKALRGRGMCEGSLALRRETHFFLGLGEPRDELPGDEAREEGGDEADVEEESGDDGY